MCVQVCVIITLTSTATCISSYTNTAERLRLHKAVILLLIMKYFVLKIVSYSHTTKPGNLLCIVSKMIVGKQCETTYTLPIR